VKPIRSALFIPGNREKWVRDAASNDADVVILDMEDSVPHGQKAVARETVSECIAPIADSNQRVYVRVNGHPNDSKGQVEKDLEAIVSEAVEGIVVPMVRQPTDITRLDSVLTHIERRDGLKEGSISLVITIETAMAMREVYGLCTAADRDVTIECGAVKGTDTNHALGFEWTGPGRKGLETLHMRQKALLDARAAGVEYPLAGTYVDVDDIDGLREDMQFAREMGYMGYVVIHPSHIAHANDLFTPDEETVEYWVGAKQALEEAMDDGQSTTRYRDDMIDTANLETADRYLSFAQHFEDELGVDID
jgi:citrate lyase subunit beta/citryl-CoA lyase